MILEYLKKSQNHFQHHLSIMEILNSYSLLLIVIFIKNLSFLFTICEFRFNSFVLICKSYIVSKAHSDIFACRQKRYWPLANDIAAARQRYSCLRHERGEEAM